MKVKQKPVVPVQSVRVGKTVEIASNTVHVKVQNNSTSILPEDSRRIINLNEIKPYGREGDMNELIDLAAERAKFSNELKVVAQEFTQARPELKGSEIDSLRRRAKNLFGLSLAEVLIEDGLPLDALGFTCYLPRNSNNKEIQKAKEEIAKKKQLEFIAELRERMKNKKPIDFKRAPEIRWKADRLFRGTGMTFKAVVLEADPKADFKALGIGARSFPPKSRDDSKDKNIRERQSVRKRPDKKARIKEAVERAAKELKGGELTVFGGTKSMIQVKVPNDIWQKCAVVLKGNGQEHGLLVSPDGKTMFHIEPIATISMDKLLSAVRNETMQAVIAPIDKAAEAVSKAKKR